jgi:hypothetical protein
MKTFIKLGLIGALAIATVTIAMAGFHYRGIREDLRIKPLLERATAECQQAGLFAPYVASPMPNVPQEENFAAVPPLLDYLAELKQCAPGEVFLDRSTNAAIKALNEKDLLIQHETRKMNHAHELAMIKFNIAKDNNHKDISDAHWDYSYIEELVGIPKAYRVSIYQQALTKVSSNQVPNYNVQIGYYSNPVLYQSVYDGSVPESTYAVQKLRITAENVKKYNSEFSTLELAAQRRKLFLPDDIRTNSMLSEIVMQRIYLYQNMLANRALLEVLSGDGSASCRDVESALNLARLLVPLWTPKLALDQRNGFMDTSLTSLIWVGVASGCWDENQLQRIQEQIPENILTNAYAGVVAYEFKHNWNWFDSEKENFKSVYGSSAVYDGMYLRPFPMDRQNLHVLMNNWLLSVGPEAWEKENAIRYARFCQDTLKPLCDDLSKAAGQRRFKTVFDSNIWELPSDVASSVLNYVESVHKRELSRRCLFQATYQQARLACALERFRLRQQRYPAVLEELTPQYIGQLPLDPVDGKPMRYRQTTDGRYALYSIGYDGQDDSGLTRLEMDAKTGRGGGNYDWVWKYSLEYKSAAYRFRWN